MAKIKICGLTRREDILAANACKPDYVGFVFAEESRRRVTKAQALALKKDLDPSIQTVGVFVNQPVKWIAELCRIGLIDLIQLHGDEDERDLLELKQLTDHPIIRAVAVGNSLPALPRSADYLLFDTAAAERGGTGRSFDWSLLDSYRGGYFLAGGLSAGNVEKGLVHQPYCVDVSSGVETDGVKDTEKMREFVQAVRAATERGLT